MYNKKAMTISVVINVVKEELDYLPAALKSVVGWADEIVIINMEAGPEIQHIAKEFSTQVIPHKRESCVEIARNFSLTKATSDWVLILDPDEQVAQSLKTKLSQIVDQNECDYVRLPRKNIIFGKWMQHSRWWPDYNIRFFKRGFVEWDEKIHSIPLTKGRGTDLPAEENLALIHYHYQSISQFLQRTDRYTNQQLHNLQADNYHFHWSDLITKPTNEFLSRYFAGAGYKDGLHGLAMSLLQFISELTLYLKAWEADKFSPRPIKPQQFEKVFKKSIKDSIWWLADAYKKQGQFTKYLSWKIKQKTF